MFSPMSKHIKIPLKLIEKVCPNCGETFSTKVSENPEIKNKIFKEGKNCCSYKCLFEYKRKLAKINHPKPEKQTYTGKCPYCKKLVVSTNPCKMFCDLECRIKYAELERKKLRNEV